MLNEYCAAVLARELAGTDYDGKTADQAWAWLMLPTPQDPVTTPTGLRLTPVTLAGLVGAAKTELVASAMKQAYPVTGDHLMTEGVDPLRAETLGFLSQLVSGGVLSEADVDAVRAAAVRVTPQADLPRRFDQRFDPQRWPHVADDGSAGGEGDEAIRGFPNDITREEFDSAWASAGRN